MGNCCGCFRRHSDDSDEDASKDNATHGKISVQVNSGNKINTVDESTQTDSEQTRAVSPEKPILNQKQSSSSSTSCPHVDWGSPATTLNAPPLPQRSNIIIPLYVYPLPGAWDGLHEIIKQHPHIQFTVIINPFNGPGPEALPDESYRKAIPKLTSYTNVEVLGYVHITYNERPLDEVIRDVRTYSSWADHHAEHPGLKVDGIFVDETPFALEEEEESYLRDLRNFTKSCNGFGGKKKIVHNPGCVPASATSLELADVTIIFEHTYEVFKERLAINLFDLTQRYPIRNDSHKIQTANRSGENPDEPLAVSDLIDRSRIGLMIHSIPANTPEDDIQNSMAKARAVAGHVFVTESETQFYENFSSRLKHWIELLG